MPSLRFDNVGFSYTDAAPILEGATFLLSEGWTGVVGPNGGGKSTLLMLMAGALKAEVGQVAILPTGAGIHQCPQRVETLTDEIEAFSWSWDRDSRRWMGLLGLDPDQILRWDTLSPGERKRWQIGAALASEPGILLLDEPTNHLDSDARGLLARALSRFCGVGVLVSHDRQFLDDLTSRTLRVANRRAELHQGNYASAKAQWELHQQQQQLRYAAVRERERQVKARLGDKRRGRAQAEANLSVRKRMTGPKDSEARGIAAKARVAHGEARLARGVTLLKRELEKVREEAAEFRFDKERGRSLFVDYEPCPRSRLVALQLDSLCAGEKMLLENISVTVERDSKIHVAGPNGCGKSTLLRALLSHTGLTPDKLLYVEQDIEVEEARNLVTSVRLLPPEERGRVLRIVAALGVDPERLLATDLPSPGEARKLQIADGLGRRVHLLILDEPTNHLDLPSIERLEVALSQYPGALLLVSHDTAFARAYTSQTWTFAGCQLRDLVDGVEVGR